MPTDPESERENAALLRWAMGVPCKLLPGCPGEHHPDCPRYPPTWAKTDPRAEIAAAEHARAIHDQYPSTPAPNALQSAVTGKHRPRKTFLCHRCGKLIGEYQAFGVGDPTKRVYCLNHIPRWVRLKMWVRRIR